MKSERVRVRRRASGVCSVLFVCVCVVCGVCVVARSLVCGWLRCLLLINFKNTLIISTLHSSC
jgi:hypothetical protein